MNTLGHLGPDLSALVDGELGHDRRDRALAHVAGCGDCRALLEQERAVKALVSGSIPPQPSARLVSALTALSLPGAPPPPRSRSTPNGPLVPRLPPPRRGPLGARRDSRGPGVGRPGRAARRARVTTVGALSAVVVVLGAAFAAGSPVRDNTRVVSPTAELSVQHTATDAGVTLGGAGTGLATTFEDVFYPPAAPR